MLGNIFFNVLQLYFLSESYGTDSTGSVCVKVVPLLEESCGAKCLCALPWELQPDIMVQPEKIV